MASNRFSTYTSVSTGSGPGSKHNDNASAGGTAHGDGPGKKKDLWNSMLESVASGRKLPERNVLVFGGSVDAQREFIESIALDPKRAGLDRLAQDPAAKLPPVAHSFALGYTYYDVLDADQEDILARISLYLLSKPSPAFSSLLQPLLTPQSIPNTLIVILLDWAQPWLWLRQLREWILLLRTVLVSLSPECKEVMEDAMLRWRERGRGGPLNLDGTSAAVEGDALPPGPGEWEDALGLPLCVVCQNAEKTDILEKTQGWKDDEFDLVLQYLRTVLIKHGASLVYTTPSVPSQLPSLVHACLGVTSLLKRAPLKPEVIKRTEVVVPSNWDSWAKIRVVRDGFDVETVSDGWSKDLQRAYPPVTRPPKHYVGDAGDKAAEPAQTPADPSLPPAETEVFESGDYEAHDALDDDDDVSDYDDGLGAPDDDPDSAVAQFERVIRDPGGIDAIALADQYGAPAESDDELSDDDDNADATVRTRRSRRKTRQQLEVETEDVQLFLGEQLKVLDAMRQKEDQQRTKDSKGRKVALDVKEDPAEVMSSHIGPVQFNIGGIQVDADDMLERMKQRQTSRTEEMRAEAAEQARTDERPVSGRDADARPDAKEALQPVDTEKMQAFFANLMHRPSQTSPET